MNIGFIGLGNMASAIIRGLQASDTFADAALYGYDSSAPAMEAAAALSVHPARSPAEAVEKSDIVLLAVKPQVLPEVLSPLADQLSKKLVITIAAGRDLAFYRAYLGASAVVRVMPNINAKVGAACSALCCSPETTPVQLELAQSVFSTVGSAILLPEAQFSAFCALSGSSVAFVYLYIDALAKAGVKAGFSKALATEIASAVVLGSAKLVQESGEHPMALVDQVCSPAGTTIEGVQVLQRLGFETAIHQAVDAVIRRDEAIKGGN